MKNRKAQYPGYPYHWNDTEPAAVVPNNWECCPTGHDDCICVTSADVNRWNEISAVSSFSAVDLSPLSAISGMDIPTSAEYWNSTYDTVSSNSAFWNDVSAVSGLETIEQKIYSLSSEIHNLSGKALTSIYTDPTELQGIGTKERPLLLANRVSDIIYLIESIIKDDTIALGSDIVKLKDDINELASQNEIQDTRLDEIDRILRELLKAIGSQSIKFWINKKVTEKESKTSADYFFYWDSLEV